VIPDGTGIADARLEAYSLPFRRPWQTRHGAVEARRGWLLHLVDDLGRRAVGEAAPWPDAGTESAADCGDALADVCRWLPGVTPAAALERLPTAAAGPAARCGVEGALYGLLARHAGQPLHRLLDARASSTVAVNAACGSADEELSRRIAAAAAAGFRVFKIKVGVRGWATELACLRALALPPGGTLRLDANGAWRAADAGRRLADLAGLPVDCVEEPLATFDPTALAALQATVPYALALDESLAGGAAALCGPGCPVRRVVLKPMVQGGVGETLARARSAAAAGLEVVVTTTLEAAPGRWLATAIAAATGSPLAHGLDTGAWLGRDLGEGPPVRRGRIRLGEDQAGS
jgi:o-succinylbenzoate synthase